MKRKEVERAILDLQIQVDKLKSKDVGPDATEELLYRMKWIEEALKPRLRRRVERRRRRYLDKLEFAANLMEAREARRRDHEE
jgi:hypothetical protein